MKLIAPLSWRFAPAGILFAPLLAVVMVPLDFGGSAVLVFASMKELLLAGAAGVFTSILVVVLAWSEAKAEDGPRS